MEETSGPSQIEADNRGQALLTENSDAGQRTVFVGGIDWKANESELLAFFQKFGEVEECKIIFDRKTKLSKGYGFVTFSAAETAKSVMKMSLVFNGKNINISEAYHKEKKFKLQGFRSVNEAVGGFFPSTLSPLSPSPPSSPSQQPFGYPMMMSPYGASVSPSVGIGPYNWSGMAYYPPFPYLYDYVFNPESSQFPFSLNPLDPSLIPDIDQHSDPNEHKIHQ